MFQPFASLRVGRGDVQCPGLSFWRILPSTLTSLLPVSQISLASWSAKLKLLKDLVSSTPRTCSLTAVCLSKFLVFKYSSLFQVRILPISSYPYLSDFQSEVHSLSVHSALFPLLALDFVS